MFACLHAKNDCFPVSMKSFELFNRKPKNEFMENNSVLLKFSLGQIRFAAKKLPPLSSFFLLIFLIFCGIFSATAFALESANFSKQGMQIKDPLPSWILDATAGNVSFYHLLISCSGKNTVFLKFENKNNYSVKISWKETFLTKQTTQQMKGFAGLKELIIPPGAILSASSCADITCKDCIIFPEKVSPAYMADIINFGFKDITATKQ